MLRAGTWQAKIQKYFSALADNAPDRLAAYARDAVGGGAKATVRVLCGEVGPALVRLSEAVGVDLLAVVAHGRGVALAALIGSVAQRVLRQAACDALTATAGQHLPTP